jgi:hypothetical protein
MRKELAIVFASVASIFPALLVASFGPPESQYGLMIVAMNISVYLIVSTLVLAFLPVLLFNLGFRSFRAYIFAALVCAALSCALVLHVAEHWINGIASAVAVFSAFVLVPVIENFSKKRIIN